MTNTHDADTVERVAKALNGPQDPTHIGSEKLRQLQDYKWINQTSKHTKAELLNDARAALSALPEIVQSMVKSLVWCPSDDKAEFYECSTADNHSYEYEVGECDFGWFFVEHILGYECSDHFGTPDAAKAAANAHHRAQVMAELDFDKGDTE